MHLPYPNDECCVPNLRTSSSSPRGVGTESVMLIIFWACSILHPHCGPSLLLDEQEPEIASWLSPDRGSLDVRCPPIPQISLLHISLISLVMRDDDLLQTVGDSHTDEVSFALHLRAPDCLYKTPSFPPRVLPHQHTAIQQFKDFKHSKHFQTQFEALQLQPNNLSRCTSPPLSLSSPPPWA